MAKTNLDLDEEVCLKCNKIKKTYQISLKCGSCGSCYHRTSNVSSCPRCGGILF